MLRSTLGLFALGTLLSAHTCNKGGEEASAALGDGKWSLQTLHGKEFQLPEGANPPSLTVDAANDRVTGSGGCNSFFGTAKVGVGTVAFSEIGRTKKYCEGIQPTEDAFLQALGTADHYVLKDDRLTLLHGTEEVAVLVRVQP